MGVPSRLIEIQELKRSDALLPVVQGAGNKSLIDIMAYFCIQLI